MTRAAEYRLQCANCHGDEEVLIRVTTRGPFVVKAGDWAVAAAKHLDWRIEEGGILCERCAGRGKP